jgi:hypothetical protein
MEHLGAVSAQALRESIHQSVEIGLKLDLALRASGIGHGPDLGTKNGLRQC